jgi:acyl-CoA dehydrogenase
MDFNETEEHALIRDAVRKVCADFPDEYWSRLDTAHEFPWDFYAAMAKAGWIGVAIPEAYGGSGRGIAEASIVLEEVAASGAAMNGASALHLSIFGMHPVVRHGSEAMKEKYLPRVARGDLHVAFGVTEPDAGTDTTSIRTFARNAGDHYLVKGRKVWTTKALDSERVLLLVRTTPLEHCERRTDGMTLLLAELQRPEVKISPIDKLGQRDCDLRSRVRRPPGREVRSRRRGGEGFQVPAGRTQCRTHPCRIGGDRDRPCRTTPGSKLRE